MGGMGRHDGKGTLNKEKLLKTQEFCPLGCPLYHRTDLTITGSSLEVDAWACVEELQGDPS